MVQTSKKLIIVESPTKARTVRSFLKDDSLIVEACYGHVRDLPNSAKDIPSAYKGYEWANLGINVENGFMPLYIIPKEKVIVINRLKKLLKEVDELYLATDEDREGESISWHLIEILKPQIPVRRMVFHEITQQAINHALLHTRTLNMNLVNAQEARRLVDRLYGYSLSPLLWKKIAYGLSAGRVQTAGLRMLIEQEEERLKFTKAVYYSLEASISTPQPLTFTLSEWQNKKIASSRHFDLHTGKINDSTVHMLTQEQAHEWQNKLKGKLGVLSDIHTKTYIVEPPLPFTTSTLQQEANRILGLSSKETMRIAQSLYEEGYITYMRTDSYQISQEAKVRAKEIIKENWGEEAVNTANRKMIKSKGAQEAHEAIRPAGNFQSPKEVQLSQASLALYQLIYNRTLASFMKPARKESTKYSLKVEESYLFTLSGVRIVDLGFLVLYPEKELERPLPILEKGAKFSIDALVSKEHQTKPPSRYSEAGLIARLEKEGIGRPSTYASIIGVLLEREYVYKSGQTLLPTFMGMAVIKMLRKHFTTLIDYHFTSVMEDKLDLIAEGTFDKETYLSDFYLSKDGLKSQIEQKDSHINPQESRLVLVLKNKNNETEVKVNRMGAYLSWKEDGKTRTLAIESKTAPSEINEEWLEQMKEQQKKANTLVGQDPQSGLPLYFCLGKYGPYLQIGEIKDNKSKPKTMRLPTNSRPDNLDWPQILKELTLPRIIGQHPISGETIIANKGPFGGFIQYQDLYISLKPEEKIFSINLQESLDLIEAKIAKEVKNTVCTWDLDELGIASVIKKGRFGLYLKVAGENLPLGKTYNKEEILKWSKEDVIKLWQERKKKKTSKKK